MRIGLMSTSRSITARILPEPSLLFGGSYPSPDPKTGLALYGPYSLSTHTVRVGIVGDRRTIDQTGQLLEMMKRSIEGPARHPRWTPSFPGMTASGPLKCEIEWSPKWYGQITSDEMEMLERKDRFEERVAYSVGLFVKYAKLLQEREDSPHIVICVPPRRMMDLCIPPELRTRERRGRRSVAEQEAMAMRRRIHPSQRLLGDFFEEFKSTEQELLEDEASENFHNFLKAKMMPLALPTQMIRPYTLDAIFNGKGRAIQDSATVAWNLAVALMYKAEARPWRLAEVPAGTCFIGISFYREKPVFGGSVGTSMAQVFSPEGEGLVLRGERFEWPRGQSPHLERDAAKRLLERAVALYTEHTRQKPMRVVVHKSSKFWEDEIDGFQSALDGIPIHDFVTVTERARRIRFYRQGYHPVLRGTTVRLPDDSWILYTKGYSPYLEVYPGPRVPRPLEVLQHIGDSPSDKINSEILGLTKLNWNSADFSSLLPITLHFSRRVGIILRELPPGTTPQTRYRFYM